MICSDPNASGKLEGLSKDDGDKFSCSMEGNKRRMWETSCTSLMSKKVKGSHSEDHHLSSQSPNWTRGSRNKFLPNSGGPDVPVTAKSYRIMLMNIADAEKKSRLSKV